MKKIIQICTDERNLYCLTEEGTVYIWESNTENGITRTGWYELKEKTERFYDDLPF